MVRRKTHMKTMISKDCKALDIAYNEFANANEVVACQTESLAIGEAIIHKMVIYYVPNDNQRSCPKCGVLLPKAFTYHAVCGWREEVKHE